MASTALHVVEYNGGISALDSGFMRDRMAACYLLEDSGEAAIIETGNFKSVPLLLKLLELRNIEREQVRYVIVTHVHLDHAGGAGLLMQELPNATFLVHPLGARHMIDPSKLEASVRQVYGDEHFDAEYGTLQPIDEARVKAMSDGENAELGRRTLVFRDSPGHARHHFCIWDEHTRGWFTGDTFGLSYRDLDSDQGPFIFPTTTPIQFDPVALKQSIELISAAQPQWIYLTHFGRIRFTRSLANNLLLGVETLVGIAESAKQGEGRTGLIQDAMTRWLVSEARTHGCCLDDTRLLEVLNSDIVLNTQGLEFWLDHGRDRTG